MTSYTLFWRGLLLLSIGAMTAGGVLALALLWRGRARPFIRNLVLILAVIYAILAYNFVHAELTGDVTAFQDWLWDLDLEYSLGTILSTVQLFAIAAAALLIAWRLRAAAIERLYWLLLGAAFIFLGTDEYFQIHETLVGVDRWRLVYALAGSLLGLLTLWMWRRTRAHRVFLIFCIGLGVMALAGILIEKALFESFCYETAGSLVPVCEDFDVYLIFEEWYELLGSGIALLALLYFAQTRLDATVWRWQKRGLLITAPLVALLLAVYLWLMPAVELRAATPVDIDYGDFKLLAYQLDTQSLAPGDALDITLYWQADDWIDTALHLSLHALAEPERSESFAQVDDLQLGQIPSTAFIPGVPVRKSLTLPFATDMPDLQTYALVLRVWHGRYERGELLGVPVERSDRPLLMEDSLRLDAVTLIDPQTSPILPATTDFRFTDNLALLGFALPDSAVQGETLSLSFRWASLGAIDRDLTQFLHLIDSSGAFVFGHDQPPFAGRMPTSDWPASAQLQDDWSVLLPEDLAPGEYRIYTGLYDYQTQERSVVADSAGQPAANNEILLGTLTVLSR